MPRDPISLDTLLILVRKGKARVKLYQNLREEGGNSTADQMLPEMFQLRKELTQGYRSLLHASDPEEQPSAELMAQVQFLLRALAPGVRRPVSEPRLKRLVKKRREKLTSTIETVASSTHGRRRKGNPTRTSRKK
jgi:hypothetical protein